MATVIDALVVTLGLDAKAFKKGSEESLKHVKKTGEEAERVGKNMERSGQQAAQFFAKLRTEALSLLAVFTAGTGLKNFTVNTINTAAGLGRMSDNLGLSTERLTAWQRVAENAGGSVSGMTARLKTATLAVANYKLGIGDESNSKGSFLGLQREDFESAETLLKGQARILHEAYKVNPQDAIAKAAMMQIDEDTFNVMKNGPAVMMANVDAMQKLSAITRKDAEEADKLRLLLKDLERKIDYVAVKILEKLMPQLEKLLTKLGAFANWVLDHQDDIATWVDGAVQKIEEFAQWVDSAAEAVGGWKNVLIGLLALKVVSAIAPLISLAAALVSVGSGLGLIAAGAAAVGVLAAAAAALPGNKATGEDEIMSRIRRGGGGSNGRLAGGSIGGGASSSGNNKDQIYKALLADGYSKEAAAGILGSLQQENSSFNPSSVNPKSGAAGIAQWLGTRATQYGQKYGHKVQEGPLSEQIEFMLWEMRNTEKKSGDALRGKVSTEDAAKIHTELYERPGSVEANIPRRQSFAKQIAATYSSEVNINGPITVQTNATDAKGVANGLSQEIKRIVSSPFGGQFDSGLN